MMLMNGRDYELIVYPRPLSHVVATNNIVRVDRWTVGMVYLLPDASKRLLCSVDGDIIEQPNLQVRGVGVGFEKYGRRCSIMLDVQYP